MDKMEIKKLFDGFYSNKKVLITGHTGFKGAWLCILLNNLGAKVYGYALDPPTNPSLYNLANIDKYIESTIGDIRDFDNLDACIRKHKPEIIIHMAAQSLVRESYKNPRETYEVNVMGTVNVFEAARQNNCVRVILNITTDKCYENKEWLWGYRENDRLGGHDPYSNSKACSEQVTSSYRDSFFNKQDTNKQQVAIASARAGNVIGGGDWAVDRLIPDFIKSIIKENTVNIRSPYAIRPWQHVLEPLSGYLSLCQKLYVDGIDYEGAWNFGPEDNDAKNVEWIINKLCTLWESNANFEIEKTPQPHEATYLKLDCSKSKTKLNWHPKWNIEKTLKSIEQWTKSYLAQDDIYQVCVNQINEYFSL